MTCVRVKICGITNVEDAKVTADLGADALGLVFYQASPRSVGIEQAQSIAVNVGPFITMTGLFVNPERQWVEEVLSEVPLHLMQFHGDESPEFCESFQRPYIKAIRMKPGIDPSIAMAAHRRASGFLLDAYRPGVPGGTGETFDWNRVPINAAASIVLAGGLNPINVAEAIRKTSVYGVDVSGGVESALGRKDHNLIKSFIINARSAR